MKAEVCVWSRGLIKVWAPDRFVEILLLAAERCYEAHFGATVERLLLTGREERRISER